MGNPIGINNQSGTVPFHFSLRQNYPNPFNPQTNVEFSVPRISNVTIKIYDINGKEIVKLIDGTVHAGVNRITYDASGLASGIYFYSMKTNEFSETKKMLLIK